jgi:hypothetical protein
MPTAASHVFVSHIHEEAALGSAVKKLIEDVFERDGVQAFLSSDLRDLPAGRKWLEEIGGQLGQCRVVVSLLSPASLVRPWVNIELGAGWIKGLRVIPLSHSGLLVSVLPRPFGDFNGVGLDQNDAAQRLLGGIADGLGLSPPSQRLDFAAMLKELRAAASKSESVPPPTASVTKHVDLEPEEVEILRVIAAAENAGVGDVLLADLPAATHIKPAAFKHYIERLSELGFAHIDYLMHGRHEVRLMAAGAKWLMDHRAMPN